MPEDSADYKAGTYRYFGTAVEAAAQSENHQVTIESDGNGLVIQVDGVELLDDAPIPTGIIDHPEWRELLTEEGREKLREVNDAE